MKRQLVPLCVVAVLAFPVVLIAEALHFGGLAWLGALLGMMFIASLFDKEGFYGEKHPFSRR